MADPASPVPAGSPIYAGPAYPVAAAPRPFRPVATLTLLALMALFYVFEILAGGADSLPVLLSLGASYGPYVKEGEYWRLVMPMFLHGGWLHILGNAYALYILGPILERVYGYARFATIYVAAGVGGALLSTSISRSVSVGASGAIFGIAGAMLVTGYLHRDVIPRRWGRAFGRGMIPFILLNLAIGFSVHGIDNWGHLGGLATGALLAVVLPPPGHDLGYGELTGAPSQAMVVVPVVVVALSMAATFNHYRTERAVDRLLEQSARLDSAHEYARELECLQQAVRLAPRDPQPHDGLGAYYLAQRKYDLAIQEFQEAVRWSEGEDYARLRLGLAYQLKGDPKKAEQIFEEVMGKAPKTAEGRRLLAVNQTLLADLFAKQQAYPDAIARYQAALALDPGLAAAHNNLAWLFATCDNPKYRDPKGALEHAQRAVALSAWKEPEFIDTLAESHFANGDFAGAVKIQEKALELAPSNSELREHMARYRAAARNAPTPPARSTPAAPIPLRSGRVL